MKKAKFFSLLFICFVLMNIAGATFVYGVNQASQQFMIHGSIAWVATVGAIAWSHWEKRAG
ncbi:MAG: hypothetical protein QNJ54_11090 [Prochloraceae cyanobacterium]|nr:hypothetical protein [Prochloraceae cyanobacterium]